MSWAKDEWKQDLPSKTLQNIYQLENELENLRKFKQQQELKIDGYVSALEKQRKEFADEKALNAVLQRDFQEATRKCANSETRTEKLTAELKHKDKQLDLGEEVLHKVQQKLKTESAKFAELQSSLERTQQEADNTLARNEKLAAEIEKLQQGKDHLYKQLQASLEKVSCLTREIDSLRKTPSTEDVNIEGEEEMAESEKEEDTTEVKESESNENSSDVFLEIMKKENNALITENEDLKIQRDQLKHIIEEKGNEIERNVAKNANVKMELLNVHKNLKESEGKISLLEKQLETRDNRIKDLERQAEELEREKQKAGEEIKCAKYNTETAKASKGQLLKEIEESTKEIKSLEYELNKVRACLKEKQERLASLQAQNEQNMAQIDALKEQVQTFKETASVVGRELEKKEQHLKALGENQHVTDGNERRRLEKLEILLIDNERLKKQVEEMEKDKEESRHAYNSVTQALESSRNMIQGLECKLKELLPLGKDGTEGRISEKNTNDIKLADAGTQFEEIATDESKKECPPLCATCEQTIVDGNVIERLQARIEELEEEQTTLEGSAEGLITQLQSKIRSLEEDKSNLERSAGEQDQIVEDLITQLEDVRSKISWGGVEDGKDDNTDIDDASEKCLPSEKVTAMEVESGLTSTQHVKAAGKEDYNKDEKNEDPRGVNGQQITRRDKYGGDLYMPRAWYTLSAEIPDNSELLKVGVEECCNTSLQVEEILTKEENRGSNDCNHDLQPVTQSIRYLMRQLLALKTVLQRSEGDAGPQHDVAVQGHIGRLGGNDATNGDGQDEANGSALLQDDEGKTTVDENATPREGKKARKACESASNTPRRELSWDNFEADEAFRAFREDINTIVKELDQAKFKNHTQKKPCEQITPEFVQVLRDLLQENNDAICSHMEEQIKQFGESLRKEWTPKATQKANTCDGLSSNREDRDDYDSDGGFQTRSIMDGKYAVDEIEIMKTKMHEIQKSIKQLIAESAVAEKMRLDAHSNLDLLQSELEERESHFEIRCEELQSVIKTASQQEIALQRQINNMRTEKEDMNCDLREMVETLKEKELELVKMSQQVKHLKADNAEKEAKLKSKIEALHQENEMMWEDYTHASRRAEEKEAEFRGLTDQLRCTEQSVKNLFNTMGSISEHLQKAKELRLYRS